MKLSPISLIAVLAAVAGSATAAPAPAPRPFERDVDIYSRVNKEEAARHWLSASLSDQAARDAHASGNHGLAAWHKKGSEIDAAHMKGHMGEKAHPVTSKTSAFQFRNDMAHKTIGWKKE